MGGGVPSPRSLKNDYTTPYLLNFQTNKGMELIKTKSFFFTSLEKNQQKDKHDQSSVGMPLKRTDGFILAKESWKETKNENEAKILPCCIWRQNRHLISIKLILFISGEDERNDEVLLILFTS